LVLVTDPSIYKQGNWKYQSANRAVGGGYMYSSGQQGDSLTMFFQQPNLDVIYLENPSFGTFVVIVDNTIVRKISATASRSVFNVHVGIRNLSNTTHRLQIIATSGPIAVGAVELMTVVPNGLGESRNRMRAFDASSPTPTTEVLPTATPIVSAPKAPQIVGLPFIDPFNTQNNWQPTGGWQLVGTSDTHGKSWFASAAQRGQISTLQSSVLIDLRSAAHPQLISFQRGKLGSGDRLGIAVELDGTGNWQLIDQQTTLTAEWHPRRVDLSSYRGHVIRLRFILDTTQPRQAPSGDAGVWLGQLLIGEQAVPPTPAPTVAEKRPPAPTSAPTNAPAVTAPPPASTSAPTNVPADTTVPPTSTKPAPTVVPTEAATDAPPPPATEPPTPTQ
jgi:hypothetical protein